MLGFYDYTVILTYLSLASSLCGMFCAFSGHLHWAIFCLALSGLFDTFDGKVARTKRNRTEDEKNFGIQIDSLCDIVCFGVYPVILCYFSGMQDLPGLAILVFYCLAGLIRLAFFNVMETGRQQKTDENRKYYQGLPITSMAVIMPFLFVASMFFPGFRYFVGLLHAAMLIVGFLFILNFRFRKPTNKELVVLVSVVAVAVFFILFYKEAWWARHGVVTKLKGVAP